MEDNKSVLDSDILAIAVSATIIIFGIWLMAL
jgi:hypothetical protein